MSELALLHERLLREPDYQTLVRLVDDRTESVLGQIERGCTSLDEYHQLAGELRGLRASRGASTMKRGQK